MEKMTKEMLRKVVDAIMPSETKLIPKYRVSHYAEYIKNNYKGLEVITGEKETYKDTKCGRLRTEGIKEYKGKTIKIKKGNEVIFEWDGTQTYRKTRDIACFILWELEK